MNWHNHPNGSPASAHDAAGKAIFELETICNDDKDYTIYTSSYDSSAGTSELHKANVAQMTNIVDIKEFVFQYETYNESLKIWEKKMVSYPDVRIEEDRVKRATCPPSN